MDRPMFDRFSQLKPRKLIDHQFADYAVQKLGKYKFD